MSIQVKTSVPSHEIAIGSGHYYALLRRVKSEGPMSLLNEPIVRKKLSDEVFARLKLLIENGELKAGDDMPSERELM
jgi:hypothetical protein